MMSRWAYSLGLRLALPWAILRLMWRNWRHRAHRADLRELLALSSLVRDDHPLWLHAASVGEVQALAALLRSIAGTTQLPLLLTVGTATGVAHARELYRELLQGQGGSLRLAVQQAPWDLPGAAARFLRANRPCAAVIVETELWPNLIAACAQGAVPLLLVSARLSARSLRRYRRFAPRLLRDTVRAFAAIAAQTAVDRERFIALGAEPARVTVGGNLKFDLPLPAGIAELGAQLRHSWGAQRPLWVAGSTHPGEEAICVDAQRQLLRNARVGQGAQSLPSLAPLLVLAPRRPERFDEVAQWLMASGVQFARVSQGAAAAGADIEVLLLDTMGALLGWYAAADAAFVGGSLVPVGGHNLLEPAALGKPVLAGPHNFNSPETTALLSAAAALTVVADAAQLAQALENSLGDTALASASGARAAAVVAANRGATARALAMIAALPPRA